MRRIFSLFFLMFVIFSAVFSHGEKKHNEKDTLKGTKVDTLTKIQITEPYEIKPTEQLFEHIHNKLVHFPIAFVVAGFILTLLGFKWSEVSSSVSVLVFLAGISAILAYFAGVAQETAFENTSKEWIVERHETLGIATTISIWVWFLFLSVKKLKKFSWLTGAITLILVLLTGFYGGILAHG